jgi:hypothetical protein
VSTLNELVEAVDPVLQPYAVAEPPAGRFSGDRAFVLEAVYEGFLMHYREPRAFSGMDPDLRLLAGDALYALGLERLAQAGDLQAVKELSDLISSTAQAEAEGRHEETEAMWDETQQRLSVRRQQPPHV